MIYSYPGGISSPLGHLDFFFMKRLDFRFFSDIIQESLIRLRFVEQESTCIILG